MNTSITKSLALLLTGVIFGGSLATAAVFTVTSTADNGPGTLRAAIVFANTNPGPDTINFNIPGAGVQTIAPTNALPAITNQVFIDGFSQPGSSANTSATSDNSVHLIRLDGYQCLDNSPVGLAFATAYPFAASPASGSTARGLCIVRFHYGITTDEASSITISGNWIGLDVDGVSRGNRSSGIYVSSFFAPGHNNLIGGTTPAARNIVSGNGSTGIYLSGSTTANNFIQGNFIGTDQTGTLPRGNAFGGIYLFTATNNLIGGPTSAARNIISASTAAGGRGIGVQGGVGNTIQGNYIGADATGQYDLGNLYDGIYITSANSTKILGNMIVNNRANGILLSGANGTIIHSNSIGTDTTGLRPFGNLGAGVSITGSNNRIGGLIAGQGNTIYYNYGAGVEVTSASAVQNDISGNSIYDNGGLAIDLTPVGINTNDVLDTDTGANGRQNFPVLTNATIAFSALSVQGTLESQPGANYRIEIFATPAWDPTNTPEGKIFLGATNVTTDGSGAANFSAAINALPAAGHLLTATATDANGNTSEFSAGIGIVTSGDISPSLAIARTGGGATTSISWPNTAAFFTLEKTVSLTPPVIWTPVTNGIVDAGGMKTFTVTNGAAGTNAFFRLKKP